MALSRCTGCKVSSSQDQPPEISQDPSSFSLCSVFHRPQETTIPSLHSEPCAFISNPGEQLDSHSQNQLGQVDSLNVQAERVRHLSAHSGSRPPIGAARPCYIPTVTVLLGHPLGSQCPHSVHLDLRSLQAQQGAGLPGKSAGQSRRS